MVLILIWHLQRACRLYVVHVSTRPSSNELILRLLLHEISASPVQRPQSAHHSLFGCQVLHCLLVLVGLRYITCKAPWSPVYPLRVCSFCHACATSILSSPTTWAPCPVCAERIHPKTPASGNSNDVFAYYLQLSHCYGRTASVCNGHAELCSRSYGNVTFIGSHDSYAYSDDPLVASRDQDVDIQTQLNMGVRLLQAQSHWWNGELHFCHTSCVLYDGGSVLDYLTQVKSFLDQNPNEVLTFLFTNPESQPVATVWKPIFDQAGLTSSIYVPPHTPMKYNEWPTLGDMIDSGKRVVMFLDYGADTTAVNFILPEFDMIWETPYGITDPSFPCSVDRISGPLSVADHMYLINHSLNKDVLGIVVSDPIDAATTNGDTSILNNAYGCAPLGGGRNPNFLLLDFVDEGDALHAADMLNGVASSGSGGSNSLNGTVGSSSTANTNSASKLTWPKTQVQILVIPMFVTFLLYP